jgi:hypothetical protein
MAQSQRAIDGGKIPGPANVPNVEEVRMFFTLPNLKTGHIAVHGHFTSTPPTGATLAAALWSALSSSWGTRLATYMHTGTLFTKVEVRDMTNYQNPVYIGTGTAVAGGGSGAAMPSENAIVLTENVNIRGRGAKGRMYVSGWVTSADVTTGGINPAVQTALNGWGSDIMSALNAQSLTPCVAQVARQAYTGLTGTNHPARNPSFATITSITCNDLNWDTQRRRGS